MVDVITTIRNVTAGAELSLPSPKKAQKLKALFLGKKSHTMSGEGKAGRSSRSVGSIEELFEEGSAMLEKRQAFILLFYVYHIGNGNFGNCQTRQRPMSVFVRNNFFMRLFYE